MTSAKPIDIDMRKEIKRFLPQNIWNALILMNNQCIIYVLFCISDLCEYKHESHYICIKKLSMFYKVLGYSLNPPRSISLNSKIITTESNLNFENVTCRTIFSCCSTTTCRCPTCSTQNIHCYCSRYLGL